MSNAFKNDVGMSDEEFIPYVSGIIEKITGVQLGKKQEVMVRSRVLKRALDLKLGTIESYAEYFLGHQDEERNALISLLTTHHTFFFREFQQFESLGKEILPAILPTIKARADKTINIWSAACSRGQEVYSLAMYLHALMPKLGADIKFKIHGTDVDPESVAIASNGVYHVTEIKEAPLALLGNHWSRGTGQIADYVKAKPSIKANTSFSTLNLTDKVFPSNKYDIIFCRNVFIYFTPAQIKEIVERFEKCMEPHGHLFLGVSESLNGLGLKLDSFGTSIYKKPNAPVLKVVDGAKTAATVTAAKPVAPAVPAKPIRVFSIDDSPTIHTLLKQILAKDSGLEHVGSAVNGKDAAEKLKSIKADVITLDIHMPEMSGIEYLKKHFKTGHPPVVMISSVSREESDLAFQALQLGASDYVEKPALANLQERGEEICLKLKTAFEANSAHIATDLTVDKAFKTKSVISKPSEVAVVLIGTISQHKKWSSFLNEWGKEAPPVYFLVEGANSGIEAFAKKIHSPHGKPQAWQADKAVLKAGEIGIGDFKTCFDKIKASYKKIAICSYDGISKKAADLVLTASGVDLFVEESKKRANPLAEAASDSAPATSFPYFCWKSLSDHG